MGKAELSCPCDRSVFFFFFFLFLKRGKLVGVCGRSGGSGGTGMAREHHLKLKDTIF